MSIENNLKRIADALEAIASKLDGVPAPKPETQGTVGTTTTESVAAPVPAPKADPAPPSAPSATAPSAPETPAVPPVQQAVPTAPTAPVVAPTMTVEELNGLLVAEYQRLGEDRGPIDEALRAHGVDSVLNLKPEQYQSVLDQVRAVQP